MKMKDCMEYDIIVLGGGFTGCAAAVAAARRGSRVLLIEASGSLGGAAVNCLVYPFMPNATKIIDEKGERQWLRLSRGIFAELSSELSKHAGAGNFLDEELKLLLDDKVIASGAELLLHAPLCGVEKKENHIERVSVVTKGGVLSFGARVFIDCTGDADLTVMAGVPTRLGREGDELCQPMTLCFRVANVDKKRFFASRELWQGLYKRLLSEGKLTNPREDILVFDHPIENMLHFNTTRIVKLDPVDPFELTRAEIEARKQVAELMRFFKENDIPGMENAELVSTAPSIGVRESRMLTGEYILTGADLVACRVFDDAVAAGNYDIDIHNPEGSGTSHYYFPEGKWYTIPYRSLIPTERDCDNLLVGGRCISVDHEAQASIRIMPICTTTGEAAGIAASLAASAGASVQRIDIKELQRIIAENGGELGKAVE